MASTDETPPYAHLCCSARLMLAVSVFCLGTVTLQSRVNLHIAILCFSAEVSEDGQYKTFDVVNVTESGAKVFFIPKQMKGYMLSVYFYGLGAGYIPGGLIADKVGPRIPILVGIAIQTVCSFLSPIILNFMSPYFLLPNRLIQGVGAGIIFPSAYRIFASWTVPLERPFLLGFALAGYPLGSASMYPLSGVLCEHGWRGWESCFYVPGIIGVGVFIMLIFLMHNTPSQSKYISQKELAYLEYHVPHGVKYHKGQVPWKRILTCAPYYAVIVSHIAQIYSISSFAMTLPSYFHTDLKMSIGDTSRDMAWLFLGLFLVRLLISVTFSKIYKRSGLSLKRFRKIYHLVGTLGPATLIVCVTFVDSREKLLIVGFIACATGLTDFAIMGGYYPTLIDLAPSYSGLLLSIANTVAFTLSGFSAVITCCVMTAEPHNGRRLLFYTQASLLATAAVFYEIFGSTERQGWDPPNEAKS